MKKLVIIFIIILTIEKISFSEINLTNIPIGVEEFEDRAIKCEVYERNNKVYIAYNNKYVKYEFDKQAFKFIIQKFYHYCMKLKGFEIFFEEKTLKNLEINKIVKNYFDDSVVETHHHVEALYFTLTTKQDGKMENLVICGLENCILIIPKFSVLKILEQINN